MRIHLALALLLLVIALGGTPVMAAEPSLEAAVAPSHLIVGAWPGAGLGDAAAPVPRLATSRLFGSTAQGIQPLGDGTFLLTLAPDQDPAVVAAHLLARPEVRFAEPDYLLHATALADPFTGTPNDTAWNAQEEMRRIEAPRAWEVTTGSPEVVIAVLDSGVLASHVDLTGKLLPGYDFLANRPGAVDDNGHGTFTAVLAAGTGNNGAGIAGVCWGCRVLPVKILDRRGLGPVSAFARAVRYAIDEGARIINLSASVTADSTLMRDVVAYAAAREVLIVAAAGNEGSDRPAYPAAYDRVVAVGATDRADRFAPVSNYGFFVDLVAPGVRITSAAISSPDATTVKDGTSLSAPLVAGTAGLLLSIRPGLSLDAVTNALVELSLDLGPAGRDDRYGGGRLSAADAVLAVMRPAQLGGAAADLAVEQASTRLLATASGFVPGEPLRSWLALADGHFLVQRNIVANGQGVASVSLSLGCDAPAGLHLLTLVGSRSGRVAVASTNLVTPPARACFTPMGVVASTRERLFFRETRHTLSGGFRTYWETNGGVPIFGFPISEEFRELNQTDGRTYTVQYFERARFEYHPEHRGTPHEVQLGLLGQLLSGGRTFPPAAAQPDTPQQRYFAATGHTLGGEFLAYWEERGGLATFGFPISEPLIEQGVQTQFFERNRFEWHEEAPAGFRVQLGLLGADLARRNSYLP